MAVNWKRVKLFAIPFFSFVGMALATHMYMHRQDGQTVSVPIQIGQPWKTGEEDKYVARLKQKFVNGADIEALKSQMKEEGFSVSTACPSQMQAAHEMPAKSICFGRNFVPAHIPGLTGLFFYVIYDDQNKVTSVDMASTLRS